ncbi:MAG: Uma2 family endonuclease [bacterium]|nr:Uma2 family endonuclease [bacterium]
MSAQAQHRLTPQEYLAIERQAETKSEYVNGEMFAMARVSPPHALIVANICRELSRSLSERPCYVFSTDLRLFVEATELYCYPDMMVVCAAPRYVDEERDTLLNPSLIVEVLSPSTEDWDRGGKFAHYRTIDSVTDYLLVRQDACHVELFHRAPEGRHWIFTETEGLDAVVELASIDVCLELRQTYHKVEDLGWSR